MTDVNQESQANGANEHFAAQGERDAVSGVAASETPQPQATDAQAIDGGAVSPSQDLRPGETPIYMGVNGIPARPPVGPQFVCPYCGGRTSAMARCDQCRGPLDPLSRQATQNTMGPWFIRDEGHPFRPGCSYGTLAQLVQRGKVTMETVLRGPTTRQFWTPLRRVPGVAHLLGICHSCQSPTQPDAMGCSRCGASFVVEEDRQNLGLGPVHLLPGQAPADRIATSTLTPSATAPTTVVNVPPMVSGAGTMATGVSRDRARLDRMEREAGALKMSLGIAAAIVVVLLAAFMLAILDGRLGLGLGIADVRASAATGSNTEVLKTPQSERRARVEAAPSKDAAEQADSGEAGLMHPDAAPGVPAISGSDAFDRAVTLAAGDTAEVVRQGIEQLRAIKTSDAALAKRINDAVKAAEARLVQLSVRKGL